MTTPRPVCPAARNLIEATENCKLAAYLDGGGTPTIGWGHTGREVHLGLVWTQQLADRVFQTDLDAFSHYVAHYVPVTLNDNQFGALVSLAYNAGLVALKEVGRQVISGEVAAALTLWQTFVHDSKGHIEGGLVTRRYNEALLFQIAC